MEPNPRHTQVKHSEAKTVGKTKNVKTKVGRPKNVLEKKHNGIESNGLRFGHVDHKDISTPRLRDMEAK